MPDISDIYKSNSNYLKADDIKTQELKLTLKDVKPEEVGKDEKKKTALVATFEEIEKQLVLNKTNAEKIGKLLGNGDYTTWHGTRVTLVTSWVQFGNDIVKAIRVVAAERGAAAPAVQQNLEGSHA